MEEEENALSTEVLSKLADCRLDPIRIQAMYAMGDVVGLGLMTQEELDEEEVYDEDGNEIQISGRQRAVRLIPPKLRYEAAKELAQYIHARKKESDGNKGPSDVTGTLLYLPDNRRTEEQPPPLRVVEEAG